MPAEMHNTTQLQAGLGIVHECLALIRHHELGMTSPQLEQKALAGGIFSGCTVRNVRNRVDEMFIPNSHRFDKTVVGHIKELALEAI